MAAPKTDLNMLGTSAPSNSITMPTIAYTREITPQASNRPNINPKTSPATAIIKLFTLYHSTNFSWYWRSYVCGQCHRPPSEYEPNS